MLNGQLVVLCCYIFNNIINDFEDIDILVDEDDVDKLKHIFLEFGIIRNPNQNVKYKTKCFLEFNVAGVEFDVMAGFTIVNNGVDYYFPLKQEDIVSYKELNGAKIPLHSVKEWGKYYQLMECFQKVEMIKNSLE